MNCITVTVYKNKEGFVFADGIKIGKIILCNGEPFLEFCDKDPTRSKERGTRYVMIKVKELQRIIDTDLPPEVLTRT